MKTNKQIVSEFFNRAYNEKDYGYVKIYFSENYVDHSPAAAKSNQDAINILKIVHTGFSDIQATMLDLIEEDGKVVARLKFEGTHTGIYMGILPSGRKVSWEAIEIFKLQSGRVIESWGYWPDIEILDQLRL